MGIEQKRPFGINVEDRKRKLINIIVKFSKENSVLGKKRVVDSWWHDSDNGKVVRDFKITCPACGKSERTYYIDYGFKDRDIDKDLKDEVYYRWAYDMLSHHIKQQIRMNGCKKHMQLILDIFGEKDGMEILDMFAKKNLLVAKLICEFINSKLQTCDALQKGDEQ